MIGKNEYLFFKIAEHQNNFFSPKQTCVHYISISIIASVELLEVISLKAHKEVLVQSLAQSVSSTLSEFGFGQASLGTICPNKFLNQQTSNLTCTNHIPMLTSSHTKQTLYYIPTFN